MVNTTLNGLNWARGIKGDQYLYLTHAFILQKPCPAGSKSFRQLQCEEIDPDYSEYFTSGSRTLLTLAYLGYI